MRFSDRVKWFLARRRRGRSAGQRRLASIVAREREHVLVLREADALAVDGPGVCYAISPPSRRTLPQRTGQSRRSVRSWDGEAVPVEQRSVGIGSGIPNPEGNGL